jgi:hypothetical protein
MADLRNPSDPPPTAAHNLVATYANVEQARHAIEVLERHGVEAGNISVLGEGVETTSAPETNEEQRATDMAVTGKVGKRALGGLILGAVLGVLIGAGGGWAVHELLGIGPSATAVAFGGGIALGAFGAYAGGWYGGASALPVSGAWADTFEAVRGGQTCVAVHAEDSDQVDKAAGALADSDAIRVVRFGRDGNRTTVA